MEPEVLLFWLFNLNSNRESKLMKLSIKSFVLLSGLSIFSFISTAQELTISDDEISRFISAVGPYTEVLKALQADMANGTPTPEKMQAGKQKISNTLAAHGWGEEYQDKSNAISQLFGIVGAEKEAKKMDDEYQQARLDAIQIEIDKYVARYGEQSLSNIRNRFEELDAAFKSLTMD